MIPLIIIPARGGSRGIPHKNIKRLCGKPLIAYSIEVAQQLTNQQHIIVTTDDCKIADVAKEWGISTPHMRPANLASDTAGSREVMIDAMDEAQRRGLDFDTIILLQPTSPMRTVDDVKEAISLYSPDIDMVVSVCEAPCNPYYDCFETDNNGYLHISKGDGLLTRRQMAPKVWQYNGAVYVINPVSLRKMAMGNFSKRKYIEMPRERSVDLDNPTDWIITETLMHNMQNHD